MKNFIKFLKMKHRKKERIMEVKSTIGSLTNISMNLKSIPLSEYREDFDFVYNLFCLYYSLHSKHLALYASLSLKMSISSSLKKFFLKKEIQYYSNCIELEQQVLYSCSDVLRKLGWFIDAEGL